jgi:hypothetical protein
MLHYLLPLPDVPVAPYQTRISVESETYEGGAKIAVWRKHQEKPLIWAYVCRMSLLLTGLKLCTSRSF